MKHVTTSGDNTAFLRIAESTRVGNIGKKIHVEFDKTKSPFRY
jgi:hypothetical protein